MKVGVGIPTYNRYDLLKPYIGKYGVDFCDWNIYIVDNGNQGIENNEIKLSKSGLIIIQNDKNVGVGASWNQLCKKIFEKNDYALILNDDI